MKKILQIAIYDFKRLLINPITFITMILVLIGCIILGVSYKIPTTPTYSVSVDGETTREFYTNFTSRTSTKDSTYNLSKILDDTELILEVQAQVNSQDSRELELISTSFEEIKKEIRKSGDLQNKYIQDPSKVQEIKNAQESLARFVNSYKSHGQFESNVYFTKTNFENLEIVSSFFTRTMTEHSKVEEIVSILYLNQSQFDRLQDIIKSKIVWHLDEEIARDLKTQYIDKAREKITKIQARMFDLNNIVDRLDTTKMEEMISLAQNYKLSCETAKYLVENELLLLLDNHFGDLNNLYNHTSIQEEEIEIGMSKAKYFLNDESLRYTQYQEPLNFNTASYKVSAFDHTYFIMAILGFLNVIFAIFCAYKLFGRDRKNGKMDVILSQDVTFGQTFAAKFLAIVMITSFMLAVYTIVNVIFSLMFYPTLANSILAVFNLNNVYQVNPVVFLIMKLVGMELQAIFYSVITIFLMNISRKFELMFAIALLIFGIATICNIFLNMYFIYCLFPFIHADLTAMLGGGTIQGGFLVTSIYRYGNFFVSLIYYLVVVVLLYIFTNQLFKKN